MEQKIKKLIENSLFKMTGKITKKQFNDIVKTLDLKMNYKKIHVVGTNGKGSVSKYLNDNLIISKNKVGLFTSPHMFNFEERIKINNNDISFIDIQQHMIDIHLKFPKYTFGFFELIFLSCLSYFETKKIDLAIFEAGIGAKKDIVNFLEFDSTIFTSFSIDHKKILGSTIEKITIDKAFAIKENNNIYYPNTIQSNSESILLERANFKNNKNINKVIIKSSNIHDQNKEFSKKILKKEFDIEARTFSLPIGRAQEILINNFVCYVDVAHNEEGIKKTLEYFNEKNIEFDNYIVSLSNDKEVKKIMKYFDNKNTFIYQNKNKRALSGFDYPDKFGKIFSLSELIKRIDKKVLFIGSFYFIEEVMKGVKDERKN